MAINDSIRDEKLRYDIEKEAAKYRHYHQIKLININVLQLKIRHHLIKAEYLNKVSLLILIQEKLLKTNKNY